MLCSRSSEKKYWSKMKKKCSGGGKARSTSETTGNKIRTVTGDFDDVGDDSIMMIENKTQKRNFFTDRAKHRECGHG